MNRSLRWKVTEQEQQITIEQFLRRKGCSHHVLTHLKRTERGILRNGEWEYTNRLVNAGDVIEVHCIETETSSGILPVPLPLSIVYEDEDLMVINKPSDMPIHPSLNNYDNTLANAVMHYFSKQELPYVYRCINRLDRDTSGLLILAKNMISGAILSQMSCSRMIHREYLAIVEGLLPDSGTINAPIARLPGSAIMRCVDYETGERAVTHFTRLEYYPHAGVKGLSLASVHLETGRTHQIRIHMQHIGHKLIGDFLYYPESRDLITRQALHSCRLSFQHPITNEPLSFFQDMPEDMKKACHN